MNPDMSMNNEETGETIRRQGCETERHDPCYLKTLVETQDDFTCNYLRLFRDYLEL